MVQLKIQYAIISVLVSIIFVMVGTLFVISSLQLKDFEKLPPNIPYSQIQNR